MIGAAGKHRQLGGELLQQAHLIQLAFGRPQCAPRFSVAMLPMYGAALRSAQSKFCCCSEPAWQPGRWGSKLGSQRELASKAEANFWAEAAVTLKLL